MRELKFRAWYSQRRTDLRMSYFTFNQALKSCHDYNDLDFKDAIEYDRIMEYTGFVDYNWKEIYEWDIVAISNNQNEEYFQVEYMKSRLSYVMCWLKTWKLRLFEDSNSSSNTDFRINTRFIYKIWNIYENPELLH